MSQTPFLFKVASEDWELDQVHRLNYRTFVEEIPQHEKSETRALVDKFHRENTYLICLDGKELAGMVAVRDKRPFSLDHKLDNLDAYLPEFDRICEVRLLSVEKDRRTGRVFPGLLKLLGEHCMDMGYDIAVISGTVRQRRLYEHMGFASFGPLVGTADALYQPMYITRRTFVKKFKAFSRLMSDPTAAERIVNFLPGPVGISEPVRKVFRSDPVSHRSKAFVRDFQNTKYLLCEIVGADRVEIMVGSGSLATDAVAAQLSLLDRPGLILRNGEFGHRLAKHARGLGLAFATVDAEYGDVFAREDIERALDDNPETGWLWAVHCETSTGVLNDLETLKEVCAVRGVKLCMDCISSIGTVPVDLRGVYLATGVSGKGLAAFPGLCMVFYDHPVSPAPHRLPRYMDVGLYAESDGIPFTHSSNLIYALQEAVERLSRDDSHESLAELSRWLREEIERMGLSILVPSQHASPAVLTIVVPQGVCSVDVGDELEREGYLVSYMSAYLRERNWIQICLMGECQRESISPLLGVLKAACVEKAGVSG